MPEANDIPESYQPGGNIRDLEERQKILKDRLILIGQNLVDFRERNEDELIELKKEIENLRIGFERIKDFLETISGEMNKFARKDDLEILKKQAKMFQPMEFVTKSDLEKLKKK